MIYFHPYTGMTKIIGVLSSKVQIFTSKINPSFKKTILNSFPPARFSHLNLSPVPVRPARFRQGINLRDQSFPP